MAAITFNAQDVDTTNPYDALPAGDYVAMVTESELKATKDGSGQYLQLKLEIQEGQMQGRKLWDRLNIQNRNTQAVEIAQRQLAQLCHAVGVMQLSDSEQLHYRPVVVKVAVRNTDRGMQNEIKGYKATAGAAPAQSFAPRAAQAPAAPPARAAAPVAPWAKA